MAISLAPVEAKHVDWWSPERTALPSCLSLPVQLCSVCRAGYFSVFCEARDISAVICVLLLFCSAQHGMRNFQQKLASCPHSSRLKCVCGQPCGLNVPRHESWKPTMPGKRHFQQALLSCVDRAELPTFFFLLFFNLERFLSKLREVS